MRRCLKSAVAPPAWLRRSIRAEELWNAQELIGRALRALGQPVEARRSFLAAIGAIESLRHEVAGGGQQQQIFLENRLSPWLGLIASARLAKRIRRSPDHRRTVEGASVARRASGRSRQPPPIAFAAGAADRGGAASAGWFRSTHNSPTNCGATNPTHRAWLS